MQPNLNSFFFSLTLPSALLTLPRASFSGKVPLEQTYSHEATSPPAAPRSITRRAEHNYDIVCANIDPPTNGYPANNKWSASRFTSMWDLCSAFGRKKENVGCLCENPGVSYDVDCYEDAANKDLYFNGGMFYLCQLRCVCKQYVKDLPLPKYLPLNRHGQKRVWWEDSNGRHTNILALLATPTAVAMPIDSTRTAAATVVNCASLSTEKRRGCVSSEETTDILPVDSWKEKNLWGVSRNRKTQSYRSCSAILCSSFADCGSAFPSIELESIGRAPCRCQLDLHSSPSEGYFNLGSCSSFLGALGKRKREMQELQLESPACACNASFVSVACCAAEEGIVWNQDSLGQVLLQ